MTLTYYALTVPPQKEAVAETILKKVGVACFIPTELRYSRMRFRRRARRADRFPLFPRYVFAAFEGVVPLYELSRLNIITGIVGFEGRPFPIPQDAIDYLQKLSGQSIPWKKAPSPHRSFRAGDVVEVVEGAFTGHVLPIVKIDAKMAQLLVQFMGKQQLVHIPLEFLDAA